MLNQIIPSKTRIKGVNRERKGLERKGKILDESLEQLKQARRLGADVMKKASVKGYSYARCYRRLRYYKKAKALKEKEFLKNTSLGDIIH